MRFTSGLSCDGSYGSMFNAPPHSWSTPFSWALGAAGLVTSLTTRFRKPDENFLKSRRGERCGGVCEPEKVDSQLRDD